jgi:uncharacterized membrane protein
MQNLAAITVHSTGTASDSAIFIATFLACLVEMVEALTIVVAVGKSVNFKVALIAAGFSAIVLSILILIVGEPIIHFVPLKVLQFAIGLILLYFGFKWIRKAILRAAGLKAKHDEAKIYQENVEKLSKLKEDTKTSMKFRFLKFLDTPIKREGFSMAFNGVFIEGLEVVIIVVSLSSANKSLSISSLGALAALVVVAIAGFIFTKALTGVPENALKMTVGIMLMSFGTFYIGEGATLKWPGKDLFILALVAIFGLIALISTSVLKLTKAKSTKP